MSTVRFGVEENLLRQVPLGLAWAHERGLILPDYGIAPDRRSFRLRPNAYGLQWVTGKAFDEAKPVFGQPFGGMVSRDGRDYVFVVFGPTPLSPNIKGSFVCLHAPKRDARSAPRLGLMLEKLVLAYSLHRAEWSPPFDPKVADWLWQNRHTWVPVPQPGIPWALRFEQGGAE